jgi:hypothetical protein
MGRAVERRQELSPDAAVVALGRLSAFAHAIHPSKVSSRLYELQGAHADTRVEAVIAFEETLSLLTALGARERAVAWVEAHPGHSGYWPCRESIELRERGRRIMRRPR